MKLTYQYGCTADTLNVDGIEEVDMTDVQRDIVLERVKNHLTTDMLNELLQMVAERRGEFSSDNEPCECCGDTVWTFTLELDKNTVLK